MNQKRNSVSSHFILIQELGNLFAIHSKMTEIIVIYLVSTAREPEMLLSSQFCKPAINRVLGSSGILLVVPQRFVRRGRMPSKYGNNQYYKGCGTGSMGHFVGRRYVLDPGKIRRWVFPNLSTDAIGLKPYVGGASVGADGTPGMTGSQAAAPYAIRSVHDFVTAACSGTQ
jgi:hypothetical protein